MEIISTPGARSRRSSREARSETVDVDLMLFFHAVAEELSFTRAAQRLGIDQSWLSHKIRDFEAKVGAQLFIRNTRNVELTGAGLALLEPTRRLAEAAERARATAALLHTAIGGVLRVGALPFSFHDRQRTSLIDSFMRRQPDVQVLISNGTTPTLIERLRAGDIDLAFVSAPIDLQAFDWLLLRENRYCLLVPEEHELAQMDLTEPTALGGCRVVIQSAHYSPAAYDLVYRPIVEAGMIAVPTSEFESAVSYASSLRMPVMCTVHAAERALVPGLKIRELSFVPRCDKYLIRTHDRRIATQEMFWDEVKQGLSTQPNLH